MKIFLITLIDALGDFDNPPKPKVPTNSKLSGDAAKVNQPETDPLYDTLMNDDALLKMTEGWNEVLQEMSNEDPNLMAEFQQFQKNFQEGTSTSE